ncbi:uncharacterized protein LOC126736992 [Anthonomus grandis grandis]|uniref:uncharacterized protein LOC126736992 n=1 Tax=Anthonomus grandis grandis TaxID=2921223 RepID=UPI0021657F65|nr:uncharacterized protein LOC126736992 [Anthonomus grandis grandis]
MPTTDLSNGGYQKIQLIGFNQKFMFLLGIWPYKTGDIKELLYESYFWLSLIYFLLFNTSGFALAILTWSDDYIATASSMGIVIEYVSCAYKILIFKSKTFKCLIRQIKIKENQILQSQDSDFIKIYRQDAQDNKSLVLLYTIMGTTGISLYFIVPLVSNIVIPLDYNNKTGIIKHHFIVFTWFPFDPDRYYWAAYLIQFFGCLYGYAYIVHGGAFHLSILSFIKLRLKIIQHIFTNFTKYSEKSQREYKLETAEQSQMVLLKLIILEHLDIIKFVKDLNQAIRIYTLFNFIISSFQLSLVVYQLFKLPFLKVIPVFTYFTTLSTHLFLIYSAAHNISIESENIASSIFKGNWDSYSFRVIKTMQMICIRAQKPLVMTIGPIADVKVTSLFQIFKALYSYICIILRISNTKID